ncbi:ABC transporter permease [uncultured Flavonifractor sp.]|uniref:ABC transporter permease n=1 Tax=uncultured Flavonifractor sp. TaxID=1193534 RepID=UPI00174919A3|nr:ABC transporter permease [uncultured Flavonifractor sp.]
MLLRAIKAEVLKCRRAPVWLAFLVLPVFPAVLGTFNYLGNLGVLEDQWYSLWSQHTLFSSMFFLPALFGVFCAWQWRLEHTDHNWNAVLTAPVPAGTLYLAKLAVDAAVSLLAMAFIGVLFVLSGKLAGITAPLPPELPRWLLLGALGGVVVCAVQLFFSLAIRAFAPPVAMALVGGILGLMVTSQGWGTAFPYSLLALGMAANNPRMELPLPSFLTGCAGYLVLAAVLSIRWLSRRDASTA